MLSASSSCGESNDNRDKAAALGAAIRLPGATLPCIATSSGG